MILVYNDGPDRIELGIAGVFERGVPREVPDLIAEALLAKTSVTFRACGPTETEE